VSVNELKRYISGIIWELQALMLPEIFQEQTHDRESYRAEAIP
jgi:hypothetical protein